MSHTRRVRFDAADGTPLRGRLRLPDAARRGGALVCHPHPAFGGHMDVWLLPTISERLAEVRVLPDTDHFFFDRDGQVADLVAEALA